jgi:valyl-tRNA synthetase
LKIKTGFLRGDKMKATGNVIRFQDVSQAVDEILSIMLNHMNDINLSVDEFYRLDKYKNKLHNISKYDWK